MRVKARVSQGQDKGIFFGRLSFKWKGRVREGEREESKIGKEEK